MRDAYFALGSTNLIRTIENVTGFVAKAQYPYQATVKNNAVVKPYLIDLELLAA